LILDGGDGTFLSPIDGGGESGFLEEFEVLVLLGVLVDF